MRRDVPAGNCTASRAGVRGTKAFCAPHSFNNPVKYVDPSGHFSCQIGAGGEDAGITTSNCEDWVNQSLAVLGLTEAGNQIVDAFWAADAQAGEGGLTIMVGGQIAGTSIQDLFSGGGFRVSAMFVFETIHLRPENILAGPMDPNNWKKVTTFAHEAVHADQGFWNAWSVQGEMEAYYTEFQLVEQMNALVADYNGAADPGGDIIDALDQRSLAQSAEIYGQGGWNSQQNLMGYRTELSSPIYPLRGWHHAIQPPAPVIPFWYR